ncbi:TIGR00282 family metallophosphoesterase [Ureaplasma zalophigenitalium]|uniref:TIGR00282 family metallophosphoesterase n=1 Tax=Ureaplasma zalophigenitalium TaxID=907723 RepID=A0ABT3BNT0_9BACT|nr:TIGR00282 family metallophosphoesterase [Ureaplasma zalophigenitalium]MCV3753917.1 TIGR00282 family metallophosphoesterase [Ureaplasma zalophigenitalium]
MKILMLGDVFSKQGRISLQKEIPIIKKEYGVDFVIANAENTTHGKGLNLRHFEELQSYGVDVFTMGNHTWDQDEIFEMLKTKDNLIRPANIEVSHPYAEFGFGSRVFHVKNLRVRVTNLLGLSIDMKGLQSNPFLCLDEIVAQNNCDIHIVDFHAETTSEKNALFLDFKNKVTILYGTHTHVPTNDARIYENTAFQTDLGMCGPSNSIIGAEPAEIIERFRNPNKRFVLTPSNNPYVFCGIIVEIDEKTLKPIHIQSIVRYQKTSKK